MPPTNVPTCTTPQELLTITLAQLPQVEHIPPPSTLETMLRMSTYEAFCGSLDCVDEGNVNRVIPRKITLQRIASELSLFLLSYQVAASRRPLDHRPDWGDRPRIVNLEPAWPPEAKIKRKKYLGGGYYYKPPSTQYVNYPKGVRDGEEILMTLNDPMKLSNLRRQRAFYQFLRALDKPECWKDGWLYPNLNYTLPESQQKKNTHKSHEYRTRPKPTPRPSLGPNAKPHIPWRKRQPGYKPPMGKATTPDEPTPGESGGLPGEADE